MLYNKRQTSDYELNPHYRPRPRLSPTNSYPTPINANQTPNAYQASNANQTINKPRHTDQATAGPVCVVCLGRYPHVLATCARSKLWDGKRNTYSRRDAKNRIINKSGFALCFNFQRPGSCASTDHVHECSGCGDPNHGAQQCPLAQTVSSIIAIPS